MKANDFAAPQGQSAKFETVGDTVEGVITYVGEWTERVNKFNNKVEQVARIGIDTGDGEPTYIWPVKGSGMASGIAEALRAADLAELLEGQTIKLRFDEAVPTDKGNPFKKYRAKITAGERPNGAGGSGSGGVPPEEPFIRDASISDL